MTSKVSVIFIGIFVLVVAIFGYTFLKQQEGATSDTVSNRIFSSLDKLDISFEERERLVLNPPKDDASAEEKKNHFLIAQSIAKEAPYLNITTCKRGNPLVFKIKDGEEFVVKNEDSIEHTISMGANQNFRIAAHSTIAILPEFKIGPGIYGYGCDASENEVGMILVTP